MTLGIVHGQFGVAQHILGFDGLVVIYRDTDRSGQGHIPITEIERVAQGLAHLFGDVGNLGGRLLGEQNDGKLVAGDARKGIKGPQQARQAP